MHCEQKVISLVLGILSCCSLAAGQSYHQTVNSPQLPLALVSCQSTFTSGSGLNYLQFCVTANGNITEFQSPQGIEHLNEGTVGEGYGVCDGSTFTRYQDYAGFGDTGNWNLSTITQPKGPNTFPLKITRQSSDGVFLLTQTFSQVAAEKIAKISMILKNTSTSSRSFTLVRYADVDANNADGGDFNNQFTADSDSAFGYNWALNPTQYGLMLSTEPTSFIHLAFVQISSLGPDPCDFATNLATNDTYFGDGSVAIAFQFTLAPGKSATIAVTYKRT